MPVKNPLFLSNETILRTLCREVHECLTQNILPFWLHKMRDPAGGWYGQMTGRGQLVKDAPRGAVLYARLLWTFSAAYRVLSIVESERVKNEKCKILLASAEMTKEYILAHFMDREHGGTFWSVTADGQPLDTKKQFYAQGFMLYGFSEYARATGDKETLDVALQLFDIIEHYGWDSEHGGYIEACTRDWQPIADMRLSAKDENYPKSQNTHLHIIEPYTNLMKCIVHSAEVHSDTCNSEKPESQQTLCTMHSSTMYSKLSSLISLFTDHILNPETHHLDLFFDMDWTRRSTTESYGHDIECSWLLHEAALVLADARILNKVEPIVKKVAAASEKGLRSLTPNPSPRGEGSIYLREQGERDESTEEKTPLSLWREGGGEAVWWVQAEAVVGFLNLYQHFGDEAALDKAVRLWQYIKTHLIDREHGEWYWSVRADGTLNLDDDHAGFWKCPYHNARMCLEILERLTN